MIDRTFQGLPVFLSALLALSVGCGLLVNDEKAVNETYAKFRQALQDENLDALKACLSSEGLKEMGGADTREKLQLAKALMPKEVKVARTTLAGDQATLEIEASMDGQKATGTVTMVREGKQWKVAKEAWSIKMDLSGLAAAGRSGPVEPFLKDPKPPPVPHAILTGHQDEVSRIVFTPDGQYLVSISHGDYTLRVWDLAAAKEKSQVKLENRPMGLALVDSGRTLVTSDAYQNLVTWPLNDGTIGSPKPLIKDSGDSFAVSRDGQLIAITAHQKPITVHHFADGTVVQKLADTEKERHLVFTPSGKIMASGGDHNVITFWDTATWKGQKCTVSKVDPGSTVFSLAFSPDGKWLATTHNDSSITVWDVGKRKEVHNFFIRNTCSWEAAFSPDGRIFATGANDRMVHLFDAKTARELAKLAHHKNDVKCVAFSPDGNTLASGGMDRIIVLWRSGAPPQPPAELPAAGADQALPKAAPAKEPEKTELFGQKNLLGNPNASQHDQFWKTKGEVSIEARAPGDPCFVIRYAAMFWQDAPIPESTDRFALLIGRVSSERINPDEGITGLPYLYGYFVNSKDDHRFNGYLQGDSMRCAAKQKDEWAPVYGVFKIPPETGAIRFFLQQASGRDAQTGSAARFDDLGIFLFDTEADATSFVERYRQMKPVVAEKPSAPTEVPVTASPPASSTPPAPAPTQPSAPALPPTALKITGIMGTVGASNVVVVVNGKILAEMGTPIDFEFEGKKHSLKLISLTDREARFQFDDAPVAVPWSADDL